MIDYYPQYFHVQHRTFRLRQTFCVLMIFNDLKKTVLIYFSILIQRQRLYAMRCNGDLKCHAIIFVSNCQLSVCTKSGAI